MIEKLRPLRVEFPESKDFRIVVITQAELRHKRFAYRLQQAFGNQVVGWFEIRPGRGPRISELGTFGKLKRIVSLIFPRQKNASGNLPDKSIRGCLRALKQFYQRLKVLRMDRIKKRGVERSERKIIGREIEHLVQFKTCEPVAVENPNADSFIERVKKLKPYFLLTLGGPLYSKELIGTASGAAINQHAGWAPEYKGNATVYWALYHRQLRFLGSTVHLLSSGADAGAILKRGNPSILPSDSPFDCFVRVVALGNELMIEAVREIMENQFAEVEDQVEGQGRTYLSKEFTPELTRRVLSDFKSGWLAMELRRNKEG